MLLMSLEPQHSCTPSALRVKPGRPQQGKHVAHSGRALLGLCRHTLPLLASSRSQQARAGGTLYLARLVSHMGPALAAHALLLVLPLLPCMSDPYAPTREAAAATFASLVALLPLSLVSCHLLPGTLRGHQAPSGCTRTGQDMGRCRAPPVNAGCPGV